MKRSVCLLTLALIAGCSDFGPSDDLSSARRRWDAWGVANYELTMWRSCECLRESSQRAMVTVKDGVVQSRVYLPDGQPVEPTWAKFYPDVPGLFAAIDTALAHGSTADVRYDAVTGAPLEIDIDREFHPVDGGYVLYVQFRQLK